MLAEPEPKVDAEMRDAGRPGDVVRMSNVGKGGVGEGGGGVGVGQLREPHPPSSQPHPHAHNHHHHNHFNHHNYLSTAQRARRSATASSSLFSPLASGPNHSTGNLHPNSEHSTTSNPPVNSSISAAQKLDSLLHAFAFKHNPPTPAIATATTATNGTVPAVTALQAPLALADVEARVFSRHGDYANAATATDNSHRLFLNSHSDTDADSLLDISLEFDSLRKPTPASTTHVRSASHSQSEYAQPSFALHSEAEYEEDDDENETHMDLLLRRKRPTHPPIRKAPPTPPPPPPVPQLPPSRTDHIASLHSALDIKNVHDARVVKILEDNLSIVDGLTVERVHDTTASPTSQIRTLQATLHDTQQTSANVITGLLRDMAQTHRALGQDAGVVQGLTRALADARRQARVALDMLECVSRDREADLRILEEVVRVVGGGREGPCVCVEVGAGVCDECNGDEKVESFPECDDEGDEDGRRQVRSAEDDVSGVDSVVASGGVEMMGAGEGEPQQHHYLELYTEDDMSGLAQQQQPQNHRSIPSSINGSLHSRSVTENSQQQGIQKRNHGKNLSVLKLVYSLVAKLEKQQVEAQHFQSRSSPTRSFTASNFTETVSTAGATAGAHRTDDAITEDDDNIDLEMIDRYCAFSPQATSHVVAPNQEAINDLYNAIVNELPEPRTPTNNAPSTIANASTTHEPGTAVEFPELLAYEDLHADLSERIVRKMEDLRRGAGTAARLLSTIVHPALDALVRENALVARESLRMAEIAIEAYAEADRASSSAASATAAAAAVAASAGLVKGAGVVPDVLLKIRKGLSFGGITTSVSAAGASAGVGWAAGENGRSLSSAGVLGGSSDGGFDVGDCLGKGNGTVASVQPVSGYAPSVSLRPTIIQRFGSVLGGVVGGITPRPTSSEINKDDTDEVTAAANPSVLDNHKALTNISVGVPSASSTTHTSQKMLEDLMAESQHMAEGLNADSSQYRQSLGVPTVSAHRNDNRNSAPLSTSSAVLADFASPESIKVAGRGTFAQSVAAAALAHARRSSEAKATASVKTLLDATAPSVAPNTQRAQLARENDHNTSTSSGSGRSSPSSSSPSSHRCYDSNDESDSLGGRRGRVIRDIFNRDAESNDIAVSVVPAVTVLGAGMRSKPKLAADAPYRESTVIEAEPPKRDPPVPMPKLREPAFPSPVTQTPRRSAFFESPAVAAFSGFGVSDAGASLSKQDSKDGQLFSYNGIDEASVKRISHSDMYNDARRKGMIIERFDKAEDGMWWDGAAVEPLPQSNQKWTPALNAGETDDAEGRGRSLSVKHIGTGAGGRVSGGSVDRGGTESCSEFEDRDHVMRRTHEALKKFSLEDAGAAGATGDRETLKHALEVLAVPMKRAKTMTSLTASKRSEVTEPTVIVATDVPAAAEPTDGGSGGKSWWKGVTRRRSSSKQPHEGAGLEPKRTSGQGMGRTFSKGGNLFTRHSADSSVSVTSSVPASTMLPAPNKYKAANGLSKTSAGGVGLAVNVADASVVTHRQSNGSNIMDNNNNKNGGRWSNSSLPSAPINDIYDHAQHQAQTRVLSVSSVSSMGSIGVRRSSWEDTQLQQQHTHTVNGRSESATTGSSGGGHDSDHVVGIGGSMRKVNANEKERRIGLVWKRK
ncbi:hypothetical protein BC830DRAFT_1165920 [Chytriomyces sp. MP71]|nr:hypothetical protein BC830DRAFT_1165920 [Chytriomyces sp. MP71]